MSITTRPIVTNRRLQEVVAHLSHAKAPVQMVVKGENDAEDHNRKLKRALRVNLMGVQIGNEGMQVSCCASCGVDGADGCEEG